MRRGKKYREALGKIRKHQLYTPVEAIELIKEIAFAQFDETIELHLRLGIDPRQPDQQVRGMVSLPFGSGKEVKVVVFAQGEKAQEAREAGAEFVGDEDLVAKIEKGWLDFDVVIATPDMMKIVSKLGKILGPRGLMPNPKMGTVTLDIGKAVRDIKKGKVEYRSDKFGIVHISLGKTSFEKNALLENYYAVMEEINRAKPATAKGKYIKNAFIATTMSPSIKIDTSKSRELLEGAG